MLDRQHSYAQQDHRGGAPGKGGGRHCGFFTQRGDMAKLFEVYTRLLQVRMSTVLRALYA
jgi:hypothetical protein